ncbi:hypothetical protein [Halostella sp. PRR32]|uniref:hypothetical protein n=1 Tax=Halostella sp. PRR32 TaxID=3098147 RepID=UPI002B1D5EA3|nr:hypothetical protein [Halostella sp. PRR32]
MFERALRPIRRSYRRARRPFRESQFLSLSISVVLAAAAVSLSLRVDVNVAYQIALFLGVAGSAYCALHHGGTVPSRDRSHSRRFFESFSVSLIMIAAANSVDGYYAGLVILSAVVSVYTFVEVSSAVDTAVSMTPDND